MYNPRRNGRVPFMYKHLVSRKINGVNCTNRLGSFPATCVSQRQFCSLHISFHIFQTSQPIRLSALIDGARFINCSNGSIQQGTTGSPRNHKSADRALFGLFKASSFPRFHEIAAHILTGLAHLQQRVAD